MNSWIQWSNGWIHGFNELMGEFMIQWNNGWINGYNGLMGEFMDTMN